MSQVTQGTRVATIGIENWTRWNTNTLTRHICDKLSGATVQQKCYRILVTYKYLLTAKCDTFYRSSVCLSVARTLDLYQEGRRLTISLNNSLNKWHTAPQTLCAVSVKRPCRRSACRKRRPDAIPMLKRYELNWTERLLTCLQQK